MEDRRLQKQYFNTMRQQEEEEEGQNAKWRDAPVFLLAWCLEGFYSWWARASLMRCGWGYYKDYFYSMHGKWKCLIWKVQQRAARVGCGGVDGGEDSHPVVHDHYSLIRSLHGVLTSAWYTLAIRLPSDSLQVAIILSEFYKRKDKYTVIRNMWGHWQFCRLSRRKPKWFSYLELAESYLNTVSFIKIHNIQYCRS